MKRIANIILNKYYYQIINMTKDIFKIAPTEFKRQLTNSLILGFLLTNLNGNRTLNVLKIFL